MRFVVSEVIRFSVPVQLSNAVHICRAQRAGDQVATKTLAKARARLLLALGDAEAAGREGGTRFLQGSQTDTAAVHAMRSAIRSMPERLQAMVEAKGGMAEY